MLCITTTLPCQEVIVAISETPAGLHKAQVGIHDHVPDGLIEEVLAHLKVGVKHSHKLPVYCHKGSHTIQHVACLVAFVLRPSCHKHIMSPCAHLGHLAVNAALDVVPCGVITNLRAQLGIMGYITKADVPLGPVCFYRNDMCKYLHLFEPMKSIRLDMSSQR